MVHTILITENPSPIDQQNGKSERLVAGPDTVLARNSQEALALFGARHAKDLEGVSPDRMVAHVRQGL